MDKKAFNWEIKNVDEAGYIEGIAAGYNNVDFGGDQILPGAFSKSLEGRSGVPMLLFHDQHRPVGKWSEFEDTKDGFISRGKISVKTRDGGEAYELAKDGALAALSIGYDVITKQMAGKVRQLKELFLHEVSLVTIGMNSNALITGVKEFEDLRVRIAAGERLTEREWESVFKNMGLTNSEAERAVRVHDLRIGQGAPDVTADDLWAAMASAEIVDLTGE